MIEACKYHYWNLPESSLKLDSVIIGACKNHHWSLQVPLLDALTACTFGSVNTDTNTLHDLIAIKIPTVWQTMEELKLERCLSFPYLIFVATLYIRCLRKIVPFPLLMPCCDFIHQVFSIEVSHAWLTVDELEAGKVHALSPIGSINYISIATMIVAVYEDRIWRWRIVIPSMLLMHILLTMSEHLKSFFLLQIFFAWREWQADIVTCNWVAVCKLSWTDAGTIECTGICKSQCYLSFQLSTHLQILMLFWDCNWLFIYKSWCSLGLQLMLICQPLLIDVGKKNMYCCLQQARYLHSMNHPSIFAHFLFKLHIRYLLLFCSTAVCVQSLSS